MRDMNRSKDVPGPLLERPYEGHAGYEQGDDEMKDMKDYPGEKLNEFGKMDEWKLSSLHDGNIGEPLKCLGQQVVVESVPMGEDKQEPVEKTAKGKGPVSKEYK